MSRVVLFLGGIFLIGAPGCSASATNGPDSTESNLGETPQQAALSKEAKNKNGYADAFYQAFLDDFEAQRLEQPITWTYRTTSDAMEAHWAEKGPSVQTVAAFRTLLDDTQAVCKATCATAAQQNFQDVWFEFRREAMRATLISECQHECDNGYAVYEQSLTFLQQ
jgi:hypothetical protein